MFPVRTSRTAILSYLAFAAAIALSVSCTKKASSSAPSETAVVVKGSANLGAISGGTVTISQFGGNTVYGTGVTGADGTFSVTLSTIPSSGTALLVTVDGGTETDEATGVMIPNPGVNLVVTSIASLSSGASVNAFTQIAYQTVKASGGDPDTVNVDISNKLGLPNIATTIPGTGSAAGTAMQNANTAFSQAVKTAGIPLATFISQTTLSNNGVTGPGNVSVVTAIANNNIAMITAEPSTLVAGYAIIPTAQWIANTLPTLIQGNLLGCATLTASDVASVVTVSNIPQGQVVVVSYADPNVVGSYSAVYSAEGTASEILSKVNAVTDCPRSVDQQAPTATPVCIVAASTSSVGASNTNSVTSTSGSSTSASTGSSTDTSSTSTSTSGGSSTSTGGTNGTSVNASAISKVSRIGSSTTPTATVSSTYTGFVFGPGGGNGVTCPQPQTFPFCSGIYAANCNSNSVGNPMPQSAYWGPGLCTSAISFPNSFGCPIVDEGSPPYHASIVYDPATGCVVCHTAINSCFAHGTRIRMAEGGDKEVERIRKGDLVWNPIRKKGFAVKSVSVNPEAANYIELRLPTASLVVTHIHPILTSRGMVRAETLKVGDKVLNERGQMVALTGIRSVPHSGAAAVYNFELDAPTADPKDHTVEANHIAAGDVTVQRFLTEKKAPAVP